MNTFIRVPVAAALLQGLVLGCGGASVAELEQKSVEDLIALHTDEEASINRAVLKEALEKKLQALPVEDLFALRRQAAAQSPPCIDYIYPSLQDQIRPDSAVIHGRVAKIEYSRDDLIRDILAREVGRTRMDIALNVLGQFPKEPPLTTLTYSPSVSWEYVNFVDEGKEYVFCLRRTGGGFEADAVTATFPVQDGVVWHVLAWAGMPVAQTWNLVSAQHALVCGHGTLDKALVEPWLARLDSDDLHTCLAALGFLMRVESDSLDASRVLDAVERQYNRLRPQLMDAPSYAQPEVLRQEMRDFDALARCAVELLARLADDGCTERMYALYVDDVSHHVTPLLDPENGFDKLMVSLVATLSPPARSERLTHLFATSGQVETEGGSRRFVLVDRHLDAIPALIDPPGDDIDALLLDMNRDPKAYRIRTHLELAFVWNVLAGRGNMDIGPTLKAVATDPASLDLGLEPSSATSDPMGSLAAYANDALRILLRSPHE